MKKIYTLVYIEGDVYCLAHIASNLFLSSIVLCVILSLLFCWVPFNALKQWFQSLFLKDQTTVTFRETSKSCSSLILDCMLVRNFRNVFQM